MELLFNCLQLDNLDQMGKLEEEGEKDKDRRGLETEEIVRGTKFPESRGQEEK